MPPNRLSRALFREIQSDLRVSCVMYSQIMKRLIAVFTLTVALISACGGVMNKQDVKECVTKASDKYSRNTNDLLINADNLDTIRFFTDVLNKELSECGVTLDEVQKILNG
jgi:hypothetical protein